MSLDAYVFQGKVYVSRKLLIKKIRRDQYIKSCQGVYHKQHVATYFGTSCSHVQRIWDRTEPVEFEPPNIGVPRAKWIKDYSDDAIILLNRGMSLPEVADSLGFNKNKLREALKQTIRGKEALMRAGVHLYVDSATQARKAY